MPAGIKVRVADRRLLIWKGDGTGDYRRMDPTDKKCKAAWQREGVAQDTPNGFYLVQPAEAPGVEGFVLVPSDEYVAGEVTVQASDDLDRADREAAEADAQAEQADAAEAKAEREREGSGA